MHASYFAGLLQRIAVYRLSACARILSAGLPEHERLPALLRVKEVTADLHLEVGMLRAEVAHLVSIRCVVAASLVRSPVLCAARRRVAYRRLFILVVN